MRGISGAGKSSWIAKNHPNAWICSADHYQVDVDGKYEFIRARAPESHGKCLKKFTWAVADPHPDIEVVVVDNTNTTVEEIAPYYKLAEAFGHEVAIVELVADPEVCAARNLHGTPAVTVGMMYQRLVSERLPKWWKRIAVNQDGTVTEVKT